MLKSSNKKETSGHGEERGTEAEGHGEERGTEAEERSSFLAKLFLRFKIQNDFRSTFRDTRETFYYIRACHTAPHSYANKGGK